MQFSLKIKLFGINNITEEKSDFITFQINRPTKTNEEDDEIIMELSSDEDTQPMIEQVPEADKVSMNQRVIEKPTVPSTKNTKSRYREFQDIEHNRTLENRKRERIPNPKYLNAISTQQTIPKSYKLAVESDDNNKWHEAMLEEMEAMKINNVWELVERPKSHNVVKSKWTYDLKKNEHGEVIRHKARLVAKGLFYSG